MGQILIIEKEVLVVEALELILQALDQPFVTTSSHSNAVRLYKAEPTDAIFLNPELPDLDAKPLLDEFQVHSEDRSRARAPAIILYSDEALVRRYGLRQVPECQLVRKPVTLDQLYTLLHGLGLTKLKVTEGAQHEKDQTAQFEMFIGQAESWLDKLKAHLVSQ